MVHSACQYRRHAYHLSKKVCRKRGRYVQKLEGRLSARDQPHLAGSATSVLAPVSSGFPRLEELVLGKFPLYRSAGCMGMAADRAGNSRSAGSEPVVAGRVSVTRHRFVLALLCFFSSPAYAGDTCLEAARLIENELRIPAGLLVAIGIRESRFHGVMWPWSVNDRGRAKRYATRRDAEIAVHRLQSESDSFDLGCFQIHWRWLGKSCADQASDLFEARTNARCAGNHLKEMRAYTGSWDKAVMAYHVGPDRKGSQIEERGRDYACAVAKTFASLRGTSVDCAR